VHGAGIDEILVQTQGSTDAFYHHDALGSTVLLTNASGNIVRSYEYDVFGQVSNPPSVDDMFSADPYANRFLYTGREFLKEANLYDYRNRVYSAELGRFLQKDPIRFDAGDVNLYRYVKNYVTRLIDPFGLTSGYDDDWQGSGGTRPDTDEGFPNASIPWSPDHPNPPVNPPANADPCCSKSACRAACYALIGALQTACSKIPAAGGWGFAAQATCRALATAAGIACLQSCEKCTMP
jgi:RHS repeat-associated protein